MTDMTERTADEIADLTPDQAWDIYVGADDPRTYTVAIVDRYVREAQSCRYLDSDARDELAGRLCEHVAHARGVA